MRKFEINDYYDSLHFESKMFGISSAEFFIVT